ncbi:MAG: guanylate kinase [Candidatus Omnitrophica bacterium]|nr:guanylate kinase [Candidatus Omnitrophota bacterium]
MIFVISGPSGSGKTTLRDKLLEDQELIREGLTKSVSLTTRPRREGERNKKDYSFITEKQFKLKLKGKKILEWTKYLGYHYATPRDFVEQQLKGGKSVILCLDLKGALKIKRLYPHKAVNVFIIPPSIKELRTRIVGRSKAQEEEIRKRLVVAKKEIASSGIYDYHLVNRNLSQAVKALKGIILKERGVN